MAFRKNTEKTLQWQKWLHKNRAGLTDCGVPDVLLDNMWDWYYFLEHGYFTPPEGTEPIIDVEQMPRSEKESLCLFLEQDDLYPTNSTLNRLQYILKRGKHADDVA